ncbi:hypothetical protein D9756_002732 [Leucocoprinus leucothites]|uniref:Aip3p/Bud6 N-terminal domain-containing protein n=1 Tax=Leucocoprinus leucothites TaxID=201217 RepID=A0A8H5LM93_9AGAR|nr:hypothetical protein D9756_002732 [Leucoagaricus leucothites]
MSSRSGTTGSRTSSTSTNSNPYHYAYTPGDVPTAVKTLLASTKELQENLRLWSVGQASESEINDLFIKVGTNFQITTDAFAYYGIDLSHIGDFIEDLRDALEAFLAEEPSPAALNENIPRVRNVFYTLLKGLQARQAAWQTASGGGRGNFMPIDHRS